MELMQQFVIESHFDIALYCPKFGFDDRPICNSIVAMSSLRCFPIWLRLICGCNKTIINDYH